MNKIIFFIFCLSIAACSSKAKKETPQPEATPPAAAHHEEMKKETQMAPQEHQMDGSKVICKTAKETRELKVITTESKGCELHYSKFGKNSVVATSKKGTQHCDDVMNRIKTKLAEAKYSCE